MGLDLRFPIGLLLAIVGLVLAIYGSLTDPSIYQRSLGDADRKPNPCVAPIEQGPFYAVAVRPADLGMSAGIRTDARARAISADGSPIPGLYICGNDMASVMEGAYPGPGITLGPALVFGWLAGRGAAAE